MGNCLWHLNLRQEAPAAKLDTRNYLSAGLCIAKKISIFMNYNYKLMLRNILLTALICMFCFFGALGAKNFKAEMACLIIPFITCGLCMWRCVILGKRNATRREHERNFHVFMRSQPYERIRR